MKSLQELVDMLLEFDGISRKLVLPRIISKLRIDSYNGDLPHSLGEDSAAIGTRCDDYVLLTTDSIVEELCLNQPRAAGFNVVLANVMDIYAAGGTPTSFAVALSYSDKHIGEEMLEGLIAGSHAFRVPIVRGHTNPKSESTYIVGSATGTVRKEDLLTAGGAKSGDRLVLLFDTDGKRGEHYELGWDSVTDKTADAIIKKLSVMTEIAGEHIVNASKDVSVAGMIGTAAMMVEYSERGGVIDIEAIDRVCPDGIGLDDWVRMYISLGYLLSVPVENINQLKRISEAHEMSFTVIGRVDDSQTLKLQRASDEQVMFDFSKGPVLTPRGKT